MKRRLLTQLRELHSPEKMLLLPGPRQVGKTTLSKMALEIWPDNGLYLNWDIANHRRQILSGEDLLADWRRADKRPMIIFDELHKMRRFKSWLKGFYDEFQDESAVWVTGSGRLDLYQKGGDSLLGRYFLYRMHPLSVGELCRTACPEFPVHDPSPIPSEDWRALCEHGGHPEPFLRRSPKFTLRWRELRRQQLLREDVRDMTGIQELDQLAILAKLLSRRSGDQLIYSALAKQVRVSENTIRSWVGTLCGLHYGFLVRPWFRNVTKALRKEPKWFLRDWSGIDDTGKLAETLCACHLLKAVEGWSDLGLGVFELRYIRDTQKREVDFLVVKDDRPWILVEAKHGRCDLSPHLAYFQEKTGAGHAFQMSLVDDFVDADCFARSGPTIVPARTLLSQLL